MKKNVILLSKTNKLFNDEALIDKLKNAPAIPVSQLRYVDIFQPSKSCCGIYAFFEGDEYHVYDSGNNKQIDCWYIGSATSKAMVDRIGNHFASRYKDFGNSLLKRIAYAVAKNKQFFNEKNPSLQLVNRMEEIMEKCFLIMQSLKLKIMLYEETKDIVLPDEIRAHEKILISHFRPAFNNPKRSKRDLNICDVSGKRVQY